MVLPLLGLLLQQQLALASDAPAGAGAPTVVAAAPSAPPEKGVGFVRGTLGANCSDMAALGTSWFYNWKPQDPCPPAQPGFVPMIWSQDFVTDIPKLRGKNYSALLGFNEPDNKGQSDMTVEQALSLWPQLEAANLRLGSPACTEGGTFGWLRQFMTAARERKLRVDFLALHWYGNCSQPQSLGAFLHKAHAEFGLPMWLTEFSCMVRQTNLSTVLCNRSLLVL